MRKLLALGLLSIFPLSVLAKEASCQQLERKLSWLKRQQTRKGISASQRREELFQYKKLKKKIEDNCLSLERKLEKAFTKSNLIYGP